MKKYRLWVCLVWCCLSPALFAQQKYALVIGNGAYTSFGSLKNPVNDAGDMADALGGLGFQVDRVVNGSRVQMEAAVERLKNNLGRSRSAYGFFFYAGHGVQHNGINYLIPVDADIRSASYLPERAVSAQAILDELNYAGNELNIVILDACRNLPRHLQRSGSRGLTVMNPPDNSIIMYATAAGAEAADGEGRNGLFTTHLLRNLKTPGLDVTEIFNRTGRDVSRASGGEQRPAIYSMYYETVYLGGPPAAAQPARPAPQPAPAPAPQQTRPAATAQPAAPPQRPVPDGFVRINGGTFTMGSPASEAGRDDEVQHQVTVSGFYLGKYEVTQKEYEAVMGTNPSQFKGPNLPVEMVSWFDAVEYCNKRSAKEGLSPAYAISGSGNNRTVTWNRSANGYRLPTEAEWEYAAKGGTKDSKVYEYSGGNSPDSVAWYNGNSGGQTHQVGTKRPNSLGLHDMSGNVWEWCWDWYGSYSSGSQTDPRGASSGSSRVYRGGSWRHTAAGVRSAYRGYNTPSFRDNNLGFRLLRPSL
jgi:formylglycine-generating enzyme required for sulfatase activity